MTAINAAILGSSPYAVDERSSTLTDIKAYVATFNTPSVSFDTIVIPKVIGGNTGDVIKVSILKGSVPDDPNEPADNGETDGRLDASDFVAEVSHTLTSPISASGIEMEFTFSTTFTQALLGNTYTVVVEQLDSSGDYVAFSPVFCTDRDGVYNYVNDDDAGAESPDTTGTEGQFYIDGGAGNLYYISGYALNLFPALNKYSLNLGVQTWTVDGTSTRDPCPAWGIYSREVVTLNSTVYGTTRALTAPLTNPLTDSLT